MGKPRLVKHANRAWDIVVWKNGQRTRISTGTQDAKIAAAMLAEAQAKDTLGLPITLRDGPKVRTEQMAWGEFIDEYTEHLNEKRDKTRRAALSRLRIAAKVIRPKTLSDMASHESLTRVRNWLVKHCKSRHGAKSRMAAIIAAMRWAEGQGMLKSVPRVPTISTAKIKRMKGRPLTPAEFKAYLKAVPEIVGPKQAESWRHLIRGLKASGLRLEESLMIHWTDPAYLRPDFSGRFPVLVIPAAMQKNDTEEDCPILPEFADLLNESTDRTGFVFQPEALRLRAREVRNPEWVGKVLVQIGEKAGIVTGQIGTEIKYASAHDLRRTCAQGMIDAGLPREYIQRVMRHADFETTERWYAAAQTQLEAENIWTHYHRTQPQKTGRKRKSKTT